MKLLYICHESLPAPEANTEQLLQTLVPLSQWLHIDLIFPGSRHETRPLLERQREITRFYGLPAQAFEQGPNLLEAPLPGWLKGNWRRALLDLYAARYSRGHGYDLIYTRDLFTLWISLMTGLPVVFETYRTNINTLRRFTLWRRICYSHANLLGIMTHSRLAQQSFVQAGFDKRRILVAYNGFSAEVMHPVLSREQARRQLHLPHDQQIVAYTGRVDPTKGLDILLPIAAQLPEVTFLIVGGTAHSPQAQWFRQCIKTTNLTNIQMIPRVSPAQVAAYLYAADCLVIPPTAKPLHQYGRTVLPLKTFLYLAAGRPIVAPDLADTREILVDQYNALLVPPDVPQKSAATIAMLLKDHPLQERLARIAQSDAHKYTWTSRAAKIAAFLHHLVDKASPTSMPYKTNREERGCHGI